LFEGPLHKTAEVETNDPLMGQFTLGVKAFVQVPVSIAPRFVVLTGRADQAVSKSVRITAGLDKPLFLEPESFNLEGKVLYDIVEEEKGRAYVVHFTAIPGTPGNLSGFLNLKTNYTEKPLLNLQIRVRLAPGNPS